MQDLTDCVNIMAANLTEQVRTIAHATVSFLLHFLGVKLMLDRCRPRRLDPEGRWSQGIWRDLGLGQYYQQYD